MIKYSFIIPHKNTPDLLQKCLDSIPRRDDVQIVVVDDNSDADKVDFSKFPGLYDPAVEVLLTKEGRGAGYARNIALQHAVGTWLVFADADDFFTEAIDALLDEYMESDSDVVFFKNVSVKVPGGEASLRGSALNRRVDLALQTGDFTLAMLYSCPWQKLIKRELIISNGILFNEVLWGNDVVFMGRVAACAKTFSASTEVAYCVTESDKSLVKDPSLQSRIVRFEQESENVEILKTTAYRNEPSIYYWHFRTWLGVWKINKFTAVSLVPRAVRASGARFIKEVIKAKSS